MQFFIIWKTELHDVDLYYHITNNSFNVMNIPEIVSFQYLITRSSTIVSYYNEPLLSLSGARSHSLMPFDQIRQVRASEDIFFVYY